MTRERLPDRRHSWTQKLVVSGTTTYVTCGEFADGRLGEIFLDVAKCGSMIRAVLATSAKLVSVSLQHGVPLETVLDMLSELDFLPAGPVAGAEDLEVTKAHSILDAVAQVVRKVYVAEAVS